MGGVFGVDGDGVVSAALAGDDGGSEEDAEKGEGSHGCFSGSVEYARMFLEDGFVRVMGLGLRISFFLIFILVISRHTLPWRPKFLRLAFG